MTAKTIQNSVGVYRTGNAWVETVNPSLLAANGGISSSSYVPNTTPGVFGANPYIYGPHWFNEDVSVNKVIPIRESVRGSLQFQFLNIFNHPAFGLGTLAAQSLSFAQTTTTITTQTPHRDSSEYRVLTSLETTIEMRARQRPKAWRPVFE